MEGVVRPPSGFSMTLALFPSITATQELVVPRSMPIAFAMIRLLVQKMRSGCLDCCSDPSIAARAEPVGRRFSACGLAPGYRLTIQALRSVRAPVQSRRIVEFG